MFEQPGECISTDELYIIQVLDKGALVLEYDNGLVVFLLEQENQSYYDNLTIETPKGQSLER